jgi:hypothetical protein
VHRKTIDLSSFLLDNPQLSGYSNAMIDKGKKKRILVTRQGKKEKRSPAAEENSHVPAVIGNIKGKT